jgi:hypothetical protein
MILYLAGLNGLNTDFFDIISLPYDFRVLVTYVDVCRGPLKNFIRKILLDSGAFSIFTGASNHNVEKYAQYLLVNKNRCELYANLDVIGNANKTMQNQLFLERAGLEPLPTFHYGSDYTLLEQMVKKYNYIGLGGLVPLAAHRSPRLRNHLTKSFSIIKNKSRVHGWGMTGPDILCSYPFYSVDSTSWLTGRSFGTLFECSGINLIKKKGSKEAAALHYRQRVALNAEAYCKLIKNITSLWASRGVVFDDKPVAILR